MSYTHQPNNDFSFIRKDWYCKKCSRRFQIFVEKYLELNFSITSHFNSMKNRDNLLRSDHKKVVDSIKNMLNQIDLFKSVLGNKSYVPLKEDTLIKNTRFPLIETTNDVLNEFYKILPKNQKYVTYEDLKRFYDDCYANEYLRYDIYDKEYSLHFDDVEFIEEKYDMKYDSIRFPRKSDRRGLSMDEYLEEEENYDSEDEYYSDDEYYRRNTYDMDNEGNVVSVKYSYLKAVVLNYLSFLYCDTCVNRYTYSECVGEKLYLLSSMVSSIYNFMVGPIQYQIIHKGGSFIKFRETLSAKLFEIKKEWEFEPLCVKWRGVRRYHELLGLVPKLLINIGIPESHYLMRSNTFFNDVIAGHPKASHGWCAEAMNELIDLELL